MKQFAVRYGPMTRREQLQHLGYLIARKNTAEDTHTWKRYAGLALAQLDDLGVISDAEWTYIYESVADWESQFYADANEYNSPVNS